ncbi:hypothetical protein, partial [Aeromonas caviae]|uniref:hypothetical protein n=2 Tax=Aeromonas caviae TaxID=648 RepID=UPI0029D53944
LIRTFPILKVHNIVMNKIYLNEYFMTDYIFSDFDFNLFDMKKHDLSEVINKKNSQGAFSAIVKKRILPFLYLFLYFVFKTFSVDRKKNTEGVVIYFAIEDMLFLSRALLVNRFCKKQAVWFWNPVASMSSGRYIDKVIYEKLFINILLLLGVNIWTFDEQDSIRYGLRYHPQIHALDFGHEKRYSGSGFFFVGQDKGRFNILLKLKETLNSRGVRCSLFISNVSHNAFYDDVKIIENAIPYNDYIKMIDSFGGIIDIVQEHQNGLTLRVLEAQFYRKKLITNNSSIKNFDFYKKENVFVLDENFSLSDLDVFLKGRFIPVDENILSKYHISSLISNMISSS